MTEELLILGGIKLQKYGLVDREANDTLIIQVVASDGVNNNTATITVHVQDANDNTPYFLNVPYNFAIMEGNYSSKAVEIGHISTADADINGNGAVTYLIDQKASSYIKNHFSVNESFVSIVQKLIFRFWLNLL